jgi:hypothetical protein
MQVDPSGRLTYHDLYCAVGLLVAGANSILAAIAFFGGIAALAAYDVPALTALLTTGALALIVGIVIVGSFLLAIAYCNRTL